MKGLAVKSALIDRRQGEDTRGRFDDESYGGRAPGTTNFLIDSRTTGYSTNHDKMSAFIGEPGVGAGALPQKCRGLPGETALENGTSLFVRRPLEDCAQ